MLNPVAIRAKDDRIGEGVQSTQRLRDAMVNVTSGLGPSATLALVPVNADRGIRPRLPRLVAMFAGPDDVGLPIVPHAVTLSLLRVGV